MELGHSAPFPPGRVPQRLQVQHLSHFVLGRDTALRRPHAQVGREVATAAVEFCQQHYGNEIQRRRVHQQRQRLPLGRREPSLTTQPLG